MSAIRFENIVKQVDDVGQTLTILQMDGVIEIQRGEFVCITGPSGSGKTTLLSILGLLDFEYEGGVSIDCGGEKVNFASIDEDDRQDICQSIRRSIGFIFQDVKVQPQRTALENATAVLQYQGVARKERDALGSKMLSNVGIENVQHQRHVAGFSGGMQQRVGIARAFVNNPEFVFADEPTAHLDSTLAKRIYTQLKEQCVHRGTTTFVITHEEALLPFADRVITLVKKEEGSGYGIQEVSPEALAEIREKYPLDPEHQVVATTDKYQHTTKPVYWKQLVVEMFFEALKEMKPLRDAILYYGFVKWFGRFSREEELFGVQRPPLYLYLSNLSSMLICSLLFAMAFLFQSLNQGIQSYQESIIQQQEYFRQSIVIPSNSTNQKMSLDLDDVQQKASAQGITIESVTEMYDLGGYAMTSRDVQYIQYEKSWPPEMLQNFRHHTVDDVEENRLAMQLIAFDDGDISLADYGIAEPMKTTSGKPKIFIRQNDNEWKNLGGFERIPQKGDVLFVVFESDGEVLRDGKRDALRLCVEFEVAGYSQLKKPKLPLAQRMNRIGNRLYHGIVETDVQKQILNWQLNAKTKMVDIPEQWHCPKYRKLSPTIELEDSVIAMNPSSYRFTMGRPQDIVLFQQMLQEYSLSKEFSLEFISEFELIHAIEKYKRVVNAIGFVLASLPVLLCAVFILLTVQTVITRKSQDLLLYRVMGAPSFALYMQSLIFALFIIVPGMGIGLGLASFAPRFVTISGDFISVPPEMIVHIQQSQISLSSLSVLVLITSLSILVTSWISVLSVLDENPTNVFRGG